MLACMSKITPFYERNETAIRFVFVLEREPDFRQIQIHNVDIQRRRKRNFFFSQAANRGHKLQQTKRQQDGRRVQFAGRRSQIAGCRSLFHQYREYPKHS